MELDTPAKLAFTVFDPESGATNKSPVIFMHGMTNTKERWEDIPQKVADATNRKAYAVDARNHGESEWRDKFSEDINRDDLLHFMDTMDIQKAILVGHSMGGRTCISATLKEPEKVEKLVVEDIFTKRLPDFLVDPAVIYIRHAKAALEQMPEGLDLETAKKFFVNYLFENLSKQMVPKKPQDSSLKSQKGRKEFDLIPTSNGRYSFRFNIYAVEQLLQNYKLHGYDLTGLYKGPASFFYGGLSENKVGEEKDNIRQSFPAAEFVEIKNANHSAHADCPAQFTEALIQFLLKE